MRSLLFILSLFACSVALAQNGQIAGTVKTYDGEPAEFVNLTLKNTKRGAIVDKEGRFSLRNVPAGNYVLVASFTGVKSVEQDVTVTANQTTNVELSLNESSKELDEVVVSASTNRYNNKNLDGSLRLTTPIQEVPQNIQIVSSDLLKDQQAISMSDGLIRNVSGLTRLEHWADMYTNISTRGTSLQAFRNGFNVASSYWGPLTEDMSFVDHIEFVKGPAGFMLASGNPAGLYNVVTKKPTGQTKGEVSFTAGSFNLYRTTLDLDGKLSKDGRLLYRLNLSAQNKGSFRENEFNDRYVIAPVISYQIDDKTKVTFEYTYQRANMTNVGSYYVFSPNGYAELPREFNMLPKGLEPTKINDHSFFATLNHDLSSNWKFTAQVSRFDANQIGSSAWPGYVNPDYTVLRSVSIWDAKSKMNLGQAFLNGDVQTGAVRHRILAGLDVAQKEYYADWGQYHDLDTDSALFDLKNPNLGIPVTGFPVWDRTTDIETRAVTQGGVITQSYYAAYVQDELGFFDNKVRLTLAGR
ncbi:MAG: TonB-dependent receptor, partial [Flavitalea sp.]